MKKKGGRIGGREKTLKEKKGRAGNLCPEKESPISIRPPKVSVSFGVTTYHRQKGEEFHMKMVQN